MSKKGKLGRKVQPPKDGPIHIGNKIEYNTLTRSQKKADKIFSDWFFGEKNSDTQILRIGATGGSGKSYLISYLLDAYNFDQSNCYVMAYTGQAVNVLRKNQILANTIHSTVMYPKEEPVYDKETGKPLLKRGVPVTKQVFVPLRRIPSEIQLIIIDEASFLPEELENILKRYNVPILEVGDPIQLPPVGDRQVFTMDTLNYFFDEVMRQDRDSGIYDLANKLRRGDNIYLSDYHDDMLFLHAQQTVEETFYRFLPFFRSADIIITNTNKQRQIVTDLYRKVILKAKTPYPMKGEKVICRRNNRQLFLDQYILTNGTIGTALDTVGRSQIDKQAGTFFMDFQPDVTKHLGMYYTNLVCDSEFFRKNYGVTDDLAYKRPGEKFEFAHAITTHLSQGASFPTVLYMDSYNRDPEYQMRIRYTAITRAEQRVIYILPYTPYPDWEVF